MSELAKVEGANFTWKAPEGADNVQDMPVVRAFDGEVGGMVNVSAWVLTPEELAEVALTGVVYLSVLGDSMPPVLVTGSEPAVVTMMKGAE